MKIPLIISIVASLIIIILILKFTITSETLEYLKTTSIRYEFFLAAIIIHFIYYILWGARLKVLINAINSNIKIGIWESSKIVIASLFLATLTPSMAGGEPVRIYLLNKDGLNVGSATASVIAERLLDLIYLLVAMPFAFFLFKDYIEIGVIRIGLWVAVFVFLIALVLFALTLRYPNKAKSFIIYISKKLRKFSKKKSDKSITDKINREVDNFHNSMMYFLKEGKSALIKGAILTVLLWSVGFMIPSCILLGLGQPPFFIESYAAQVLLIIIIMMPTTPGSSGVTEGGAAALYSVLISSSLIGVFVLLFRLITYHMNLILGAIFQYRIFKSVASFSLDNIKKQK